MKKKFYPAFKGMKDALQHRSIRIQIILAILACAGGFVLDCTLEEWMTVLLCIGSVLVAELFNTCIEKLCDLITIEHCEKIRIIKDMSAAAVLFASLIALLEAVLILLQHL